MAIIDKKCSRCKLDIHCNAAAIESCNCYKIILSEETVDYLKETQYNCLCNDCLKLLNDEVLRAQKEGSTMRQGVHYYIENGNYVFTELYHIQRGYCCGSGCRHCAYGRQHS